MLEIGFNSNLVGYSCGVKLQKSLTMKKKKYVVKTLGWYGDKSLRNKVKERYKVNTTSKSVFLVNKIEK